MNAIVELFTKQTIRIIFFIIFFHHFFRALHSYSPSLSTILETVNDFIHYFAFNFFFSKRKTTKNCDELKYKKKTTKTFLN